MIMKKNEVLTTIVFLIAFLVYSIYMFMWGMLNNARYFGIFLGIIQSSVVFIFRNLSLHRSKKKIKSKNILFILVLGVLFFFLSYFKAKANGLEMSDRVIVQISYLTIPALYAFLIINIISIKTWHKLMKFILITSIILYIFSVGIGNFFSINEWLMISGGNSPFESSTYSGIFTISAFYFQYYGEISDYKDKKMRIYFILSVAFSIFSWKRLSVLFVFLIWFVGRYFDFNRKVSKFFSLITALIFCEATTIYTQFVEGNLSLFNINAYQFTTGRTYILSLWQAYGYISAGYGSSYDFIHRYLEMDLVQMYLEIGFIAVLFFSLCYFNLVGNNFYGYCVMVYEFLNLLTASSFPSVFEWILTLVFIGSLGFESSIKGERLHGN